jgi:plastocyanin
LAAIEERQVQAVRLRKRILFCIGALLGAAVVCLPAIAGSETIPTIEAYEYGSGYKYHYWQPATAATAPGGVVKFGNPYAEANHGLKFTGGPATPSCSGIPAAAGEASGAPSWHGECSFPAAGTYTFICTVHPTEMKGTITVSAGETSTSTSPTQPAPSPTTTTGAPSLGGQPGGGTPGSSGALGSPLLGGLASAVRLAPGRHGISVRGSVDVSQAGAGGRLEVDLLARRASLARSGGAMRVRVGRLVRSPLLAGVVSFTVPLDARAARALRSRRRLALAVKLVLTPVHGAAVSSVRGVLLRR